ncbi:CotH kinase family protein [Intestinibacter bartlettii]|uniref:CotH kinase family protein n=1 Tax=Intestinibacter bartlettii TaxID=261299 RepID=UPI002675BED5|nr:CotH kinase family protein [Intestinibacter bartlettii]
MIKYDYEITVNGNQAKLNKDIYLFRGNKNVHYYFAVKNASFNFKGSTDLIEKTNAINAAVTVIKPNNVEVASAIAKVENGKIHLKVTEDLIDEEVEVGDFDLVFDLFDDTDGAVTIPKVIGQFHVLERPCTTPISELVATNTTNEVDQALTDYAIVTYAEPVASTNADGTFAKKTWVAKEKITTAELNRMEEGISDVSSQCKEIANKIDSGTINTDTTENILPRVYLVGDEFSNMTRDKNEVKMQLAYRHRNNNFNANIKIKFQGSSSLTYAKKNFTIKMYTDGTYTTKLKKQFKNWGISTNKYVLKANYIDRTHARNIISARIWGDIVKTRKSIPTFMQSCPNSGAIDGFPVKLFVNGEYQGMYTFNLAKDSYLFNFTDDTNAFICCGESNSGMFYNTTGWTVEYPDVAPTSWTTLITNFVNFINNSTDEEFKTNFNQYADLASFLDYYIFAYSNCGLDSLGKNMIVTSDTGDKLYASMYDLDSTWGLWWNGGKIVDYNYPCPDLYQENNSALWKRFEPIFKDEIYARYIELTTFGMPLNPVDLIERFEEFDEIITEDLIKQDKEIFTALPTVGSYKQIRTFINQRKIYVDDCMLKIKNGTMHETKQIESISINESITQLAQGNTAQLTVSVTPTDITDYTVIWSSNKEDIASVSTSGLVTALKIGDVTITAKIGEIMDTITLSVIENKGALTVKLNANTGYLLGSDSEIAVGNVTTALPINTLGLGYALSNAGNDYSSIVKCGNRKYVKGSVVKTTDEECIGAGWNLLWIRILNETLNGESVKDWVIKNNFEFTYDLSSVNMKWEDYTLPTNRTWGVENLDESYYKCYTKYYTTDITPPDYQFNFPSVWYNNNISHSQKDYYGNNTMGLYTQSWSGNTYLVLTIKKTDLASNTSDAVNKYLTNNPIILKYPVSI